MPRKKGHGRGRNRGRGRGKETGNMEGLTDVSFLESEVQSLDASFEESEDDLEKNNLCTKSPNRSEMLEEFEKVDTNDRADSSSIQSSSCEFDKELKEPREVFENIIDTDNPQRKECKEKIEVDYRIKESSTKKEIFYSKTDSTSLVLANLSKTAVKLESQVRLEGDLIDFGCNSLQERQEEKENESTKSVNSVKFQNSSSLRKLVTADESKNSEKERDDSNNVLQTNEYSCIRREEDISSAYPCTGNISELLCSIEDNQHYNITNETKERIDSSTENINTSDLLKKTDESNELLTERLFKADESKTKLSMKSTSYDISESSTLRINSDGVKGDSRSNLLELKNSESSNLKLDLDKEPSDTSDGIKLNKAISEKTLPSLSQYKVNKEKIDPLLGISKVSICTGSTFNETEKGEVKSMVSRMDPGQEVNSKSMTVSEKDEDIRDGSLSIVERVGANSVFNLEKNKCTFSTYDFIKASKTSRNKDSSSLMLDNHLETSINQNEGNDNCSTSLLKDNGNFIPKTKQEEDILCNLGQNEGIVNISDMIDETRDANDTKKKVNEHSDLMFDNESDSNCTLAHKVDQKEDSSYRIDNNDVVCETVEGDGSLFLKKNLIKVNINSESTRVSQDKDNDTKTLHEQLKEVNENPVSVRDKTRNDDVCNLSELKNKEYGKNCGYSDNLERILNINANHQLGSEILNQATLEYSSNNQETTVNDNIKKDKNILITNSHLEKVMKESDIHVAKPNICKETSYNNLYNTDNVDLQGSFISVKSEPLEDELQNSLNNSTNSNGSQSLQDIAGCERLKDIRIDSTEKNADEVDTVKISIKQEPLSDIEEEAFLGFNSCIKGQSKGEALSAIVRQIEYEAEKKKQKKKAMKIQLQVETHVKLERLDASTLDSKNMSAIKHNKSDQVTKNISNIQQAKTRKRKVTLNRNTENYILGGKKAKIDTNEIKISDKIKTAWKLGADGSKLQPIKSLKVSEEKTKSTNEKQQSREASLKSIKNKNLKLTKIKNLRINEKQKQQTFKTSEHERLKQTPIMGLGQGHPETKKDVKTKNKIPGQSFIIGISGAGKNGKTLFNCVLCFNKGLESCQLGPKLNKHIHTRNHVLRVMEIENHELFNKYKNSSAPDQELIDEILKYEDQIGKQTFVLTRLGDYEDKRKYLDHKISGLRKNISSKASITNEAKNAFAVDGFTELKSSNEPKISRTVTKHDEVTYQIRSSNIQASYAKNLTNFHIFIVGDDRVNDMVREMDRERYQITTCSVDVGTLPRIFKVIDEQLKKKKNYYDIVVILGFMKELLLTLPSSVRVNRNLSIQNIEEQFLEANRKWNEVKVIWTLPLVPDLNRYYESHDLFSTNKDIEMKELKEDEKVFFNFVSNLKDRMREKKIFYINMNTFDRGKKVKQLLTIENQAEGLITHESSFTHDGIKPRAKVAERFIRSLGQMLKHVQRCSNPGKRKTENHSTESPSTGAKKPKIQSISYEDKNFKEGIQNPSQEILGEFNQQPLYSEDTNYICDNLQESRRNLSGIENLNVLIVGDTRADKVILEDDQSKFKFIKIKSMKAAYFRRILEQVTILLEEERYDVVIIIGFHGDLSRWESKDLPLRLNAKFSLDSVIKSLIKAHESWTRSFPRLRVVWTLPIIPDFVNYCKIHGSPTAARNALDDLEKEEKDYRLHVNNIKNQIIMKRLHVIDMNSIGEEIKDDLHKEENKTCNSTFSKDGLLSNPKFAKLFIQSLIQLLKEKSRVTSLDIELKEAPNQEQHKPGTLEMEENNPEETEISSSRVYYDCIVIISNSFYKSALQAFASDKVRIYADEDVSLNDIGNFIKKKSDEVPQKTLWLTLVGSLCICKSSNWGVCMKSSTNCANPLLYITPSPNIVNSVNIDSIVDKIRDATLLLLEEMKLAIPSEADACILPPSIPVLASEEMLSHKSIHHLNCTRCDVYVCSEKSIRALGFAFTRLNEEVLSLIIKDVSKMGLSSRLFENYLNGLPKYHIQIINVVPSKIARPLFKFYNMWEDCVDIFISQFLKPSSPQSSKVSGLVKLLDNMVEITKTHPKESGKYQEMVSNLSSHSYINQIITPSVKPFKEIPEQPSKSSVALEPKISSPGKDLKLRCLYNQIVFIGCQNQLSQIPLPKFGVPVSLWNLKLPTDWKNVEEKLSSLPPNKTKILFLIIVDVSIIGEETLDSECKKFNCADPMVYCTLGISSSSVFIEKKIRCFKKLAIKINKFKESNVCFAPMRFRYCTEKQYSTDKKHHLKLHDAIRSEFKPCILDGVKTDWLKAVLQFNEIWNNEIIESLKSAPSIVISEINKYLKSSTPHIYWMNSETLIADKKLSMENQLFYKDLLTSLHYPSVDIFESDLVVTASEFHEVKNIDVCQAVFEFLIALNHDDSLFKPFDHVYLLGSREFFGCYPWKEVKNLSMVYHDFNVSNSRDKLFDVVRKNFPLPDNSVFIVGLNLSVGLIMDQVSPQCKEKGCETVIPIYNIEDLSCNVVESIQMFLELCTAFSSIVPIMLLPIFPSRVLLIDVGNEHHHSLSHTSSDGKTFFVSGSQKKWEDNLENLVLAWNVCTKQHHNKVSNFSIIPKYPFVRSAFPVSLISNVDPNPLENEIKDWRLILDAVLKSFLSGFKEEIINVDNHTSEVNVNASSHDRNVLEQPLSESEFEEVSVKSFSNQCSNNRGLEQTKFNVSEFGASASSSPFPKSAEELEEMKRGFKVSGQDTTGYTSNNSQYTNANFQKNNSASLYSQRVDECKVPYTQGKGNVPPYHNYGSEAFFNSSNNNDIGFDQPFNQDLNSCNQIISWSDKNTFHNNHSFYNDQNSSYINQSFSINDQSYYYAQNSSYNNQASAVNSMPCSLSSTSYTSHQPNPSEVIQRTVKIWNFSNVVPKEFFYAFFEAVDSQIITKTFPDHFIVQSLSGSSVTTDMIVKKLNGCFIGDEILYAAYTDNATVLPPLTNVQEKYLSTIFNNVYEKYRDAIVENIVQKVQRVIDVINYKTEKCDGSCGGYFNTCNFYHKKEDRRRSPATFTYLNKLCPYESGFDHYCKFGDKCSYAHNIYEQMFHPSNFQTVQCQIHYGDNSARTTICKFAHADTPEVLLTSYWRDCLVFGAKNTIEYLIGAIKALYKLLDKKGVKILLVSPWTTFLDILNGVAYRFLQQQKLSSVCLTSDSNEVVSSAKYDVILGTPEMMAKIKWNCLLTGTPGVLIVDDIKQIMNDSFHLTSLVILKENLKCLSTAEGKLNKVFVARFYEDDLLGAVNHQMELNLTIIRDAAVPITSTVIPTSSESKPVQTKQFVSQEIVPCKESDPSRRSRSIFSSSLPTSSSSSSSASSSSSSTASSSTSRSRSRSSSSKRKRSWRRSSSQKRKKASSSMRRRSQSKSKVFSSSASKSKITSRRSQNKTTISLSSSRRSDSTSRFSSSRRRSRSKNKISSSRKRSPSKNRISTPRKRNQIKSRVSSSRRRSRSKSRVSSSRRRSRSKSRISSSRRRSQSKSTVSSSTRRSLSKSRISSSRRRSRSNSRISFSSRKSRSKSRISTSRTKSQSKSRVSSSTRRSRSKSRISSSRTFANSSSSSKVSSSKRSRSRSRRKSDSKHERDGDKPRSLLKELGEDFYNSFLKEEKELKELQEDRFNAFKTFPDLHPERNFYYDIFSQGYDKAYGTKTSPELKEQKERFWIKFWDKTMNSSEENELKKKREELIEKFRRKKLGLPNLNPSPSTVSSDITDDKKRSTILLESTKSCSGISSNVANSPSSGSSPLCDLTASAAKLTGPPVVNKTLSIVSSPKITSLETDSDFTVEGSVILLEQLSERLGMLGLTLNAIIKSAREKGLKTPEGLGVFCDDETKTLMDMVVGKMKTIFSKTGDPLLERAVRFTQKLIEHSKRAPKTVEDLNLNLTAIAKASLGKGSDFTINLIKTAVAYEGHGPLSLDQINQIYLRVCGLHFEMSSKDS